MIFQLNKLSTIPKELIRIGNNIKITFLDKERTQVIEGIVSSYHKPSQTIKVRRVFQEIGFERIFSLYSPQIQSIKMLKSKKR